MTSEHSSGINPVIIGSDRGGGSAAPGFEGNYRVIRLLGRGTMSSVYLAEQVSMARPVALKILSPSLAGDPAFIERFMREARTSARLNHPNIVTAIDFGEYDSRFFLAMEFVDGMALSTLIERDGALEENRVVGIGLQVIAALAHAAEHNVVHLDIKPANIMIRKDGRVKLADFGLAMILDAPAGAEASRRAVGTPYYMAPEQVEGGALDWRADQFSLGASLYEAVTGQKPFQGNSVSDILVKRFFEKPEPAWLVNPRRASRGFSAVLEKMLSRSPDGRYQSLADMEKDFTRLKEGKKPVVAKIHGSQALHAPSSASWDTFGHGVVSSRVNSLLWQKRWTGLIYASLLVWVMLAAYAAVHYSEIAGPRPRVVRSEYLEQLEHLPEGLRTPLREHWVGASALFTRAVTEPTIDNIRQAIHSYRLIATNREYRNTAYATAAKRRLEALESELRRREETAEVWP